MFKSSAWFFFKIINIISISGVIYSLLLNYWFSDCINLHTESIQEIIMAQHMSWFMKFSYFPMLLYVCYSNFIPQEWWPLFSFHMWSAMPDFVVYPLSITHWCSSDLTSRGSMFPLYIPSSKFKLIFVESTLVEGNPKAPFSIAITLTSRGGCYSFPWIAPLYPWSVTYNTKC